MLKLGIKAEKMAVELLVGEIVVIKIFQGRKWLYKAYELKKASKGVNVAAGAVKFSDESAKAMYDLGTYHYFVSIKNGVAKVNINFTKVITPGSMELVETTLKANVADKIKVVTNTVTPRLKKVFNYLSKKGGTYQGYTVIKNWNPLSPFVLIKNLL
ncbi:hypothetical protein [Kordia sp.]|uniref:hypothetical protein n=1 Tax=Kordia sp. TaxID=1965332 RepID=UPI003D27FA6F